MGATDSVELITPAGPDFGHADEGINQVPEHCINTKYLFLN
jgi:hypothetical protein